jgi:2,3-bisphosphoglycerate-independent phosphoglycerate mutase
MRAKNMRADECGMFGETELQKGSLGTFRAKEILPLTMAHAGRFKKYGA